MKVGHLEPLVKELGHALEGALNNPEDRHKRGGERFLKEAREKIGAETQ